jgi:hypothetical protein
MAAKRVRVALPLEEGAPGDGRHRLGQVADRTREARAEAPGEHDRLARLHSVS